MSKQRKDVDFFYTVCFGINAKTKTLYFKLLKI